LLWNHNAHDSDWLVSHSGQMTGKPEVIGSSLGLVTTNAPAVSDQSLERADVPLLIVVSERKTAPEWPTSVQNLGHHFPEPRFWITSCLPNRTESLHAGLRVFSHGRGYRFEPSEPGLTIELTRLRRLAKPTVAGRAQRRVRRHSLHGPHAWTQATRPL
jgi:hypothetical protein